MLIRVIDSEKKERKLKAILYLYCLAGPTMIRTIRNKKKIGYGFQIFPIKLTARLTDVGTNHAVGPFITILAIQ